MILNVALLPRDIVEPERKVCVVVDVLRATSTLVTMLQAGCQDILLEPTVVAARAHVGQGKLICGEEGGLRPDGFDHGNSPGEYAGRQLRGRSIVFATTNGTKALQLARRSPLVLAGSLLNGPAVTALAFREAEARGLDLQLVCAGRVNGTSFSLDDTFCVGYLADLLVAHGRFVIRHASEATGPQASTAVQPNYLHDSAIAALRLYRSYRAEQPSVTTAALAAFNDSSGGRALTTLGLAGDLTFCAQAGTSTVVPQAVPTVDSSGVRVVEATL